MFIPSRHGVDRRRRGRRLGSGSSPSSLRSAIAAMILSSSASVASAARFKPKDRAELKAQVDMCLDADKTGQSTSAPACVAGCTDSTCDGMADWDVSLVTDMSFLFLDKSMKDDYRRKGTRNFKNFNANIGRWDVSKVKTMKGMFWSNEKFNQDIGAWNVSKVTNMEGMFNSAKAFDQDIGAWDVSSVTNMKVMFNSAQAFNQDIIKWDVSKVTNMESMFERAKKFLHTLECWNDGAVWQFKDTFKGADAFRLQFRRKDFQFNSKGPPSAWEDEGLVKKCCGVSAPTNGGMGSCDSVLDRKTYCWPTCDAGYVRTGYRSCDFGVLTDSIKCNAPCEASGPIANGVPVSDCTSFAHGTSCFPKCDAGYGLRGSRSCNDGKVTDTAVCEVPNRYQPKDAAELKAQVEKCLKADPTGLSTTHPDCAMGCTGSTCDGMADWDVSLVTDMSTLFKSKSNFNANIGRWDVSNVTQMTYMFDNALKFNQDIGRWDVSNVTDMTGIFMGAKTFNQDIGKWDVSKVTNMWNMFRGAEEFNRDIGAWNVSSAWRIRLMFNGARKFNQDIGSWDVSNANDMYGMFCGASVFNQDIGEWDVSNVYEMGQMFEGARKFNQDIGSWDVSSARYMYSMFEDAEVFNQDISRWNVSKVTTMKQMFKGAKAFDQDISDWNVSNVKNFYCTFCFATKFMKNREKKLWSKWIPSSTASLGAAADASFSPPSFGAAPALALAAVVAVAGFAIRGACRRPPSSDEENTVLLKRGKYGALSA